jgi:hypothetical protein
MPWARETDKKLMDQAQTSEHQNILGKAVLPHKKKCFFLRKILKIYF